jgi:hypothetical protein
MKGKTMMIWPTNQTKQKNKSGRSAQKKGTAVGHHQHHDVETLFAIPTASGDS